MWYVHIKHDNVPDDTGGRTGKNRISIGPFSRKSAVYEMKLLKEKHRVLHTFKSREVLCIIKIEEEPLQL